jgi:uncharacterized protein (TIGR01777 family)
MQILITGATGLIGKKIGKQLVQKGHKITVVSRNRKKAQMRLPFPCDVIEGDLGHALIPELGKISFDAVIHLLGEPVAEGRWTKEKKKQIIDSRVLSTQNLIASLAHAPQVFLSASAIGFYGEGGQELLSENSASGSGFLPDVCVQWENEIFKVKNKFPETRIVAGRIGIVLDCEGGALPKMAYPFRLGIGGALGSGKQWMSWIHSKDLLEMIEFCLLNPKVHGPINFVGPQPATNLELSRQLAVSLNRPLGLKVPVFTLKILYGELASVLLFSQKVSSQKIQNLGFHFQFESLQKAFGDLCEDWKKGEDIFISEQYLPASAEEVFRFFSEAKNLEQITPPTLNFNVLNVSTPQIQKGTLIDYKLKIHGFPVKWRTLIDDWKPAEKFVDTQIKGPYQLWHHTHFFESLGSGTLMTDRVRYKLPMGFIGWVVAGLWVKSDVEKIFEFRRNFISEMKF